MTTTGYVHLYTGNGKGKTTAALGLALRMAGAGRRSLIIQFMKGRPYSELEAVKRLNGLIRIEQYGSPDLCVPEAGNLAVHREFARRGLARSREAVIDDAYSLVVLDEIVTAVYFTLVTADEVTGLIAVKHPALELVLTGRYATPDLIGQCDLVTEMKEVRHYYQTGVEARKGIEM
ncbi:MAG: cob(I)yrinic acid a,c-diamide adenosyltransferase [Thermodesulfobacteriota bacterium]